MRKILDSVLKILAGVSFIAMVALTCWQVFTRYILQNPSSWSEELVSYLFAWMSLFGSSLVVGERGHMNIPIVVDMMNDKIRKALALFAEGIACLFSLVILVYGGVQISSLAMGQLTSSLGVAVGVFYIMMPITGIVNIMYTVLNMIDIVKGNISLDSVSEVDQAIEHVEKEGL